MKLSISSLGLSPKIVWLMKKPAILSFLRGFAPLREIFLF